MATDIVLKDRNGQDVTYKGIETVTFDTPVDGVQTTFTHGTIVEGVNIEPDFTDGDQVISVPDGSLVKEATIAKPPALVPENIRAGTNVAGVVGELIGDTEERTVDLNFPFGAIETDILPQTTYSDFALNSTYGVYAVDTEVPYTLTIGETYMVVWDGELFECVAQDASALNAGGVVLGNGALWPGLSGNNEPFAIATTNQGAAITGSITDTEAGGSHTIRIYQTTEGVADMVVTPSSEDKVMSQVKITKPETLIPKNIAKNVNIGGVVGTFEGGGNIGTGAYNVTVIDYDGTVLAEKNLDGGEVFTLPDVPEHAGLVFDGWSSPVTITDNTVTVENQDITIGPMYHTASGATEIDIVLTKVTGLTFTFRSSMLTGMTSIDWGDGTTDSTLTHTYSDYGMYTIKIYGMTKTASGSSSAGGIVDVKNYFIVAVRFSSDVISLGSYAFYKCLSLKGVTMPRGITNIGNYAFDQCARLNSLTIPSSVTVVSTCLVELCRNLKRVAIPFGVTTLYGKVFYSCHALESISIPSSVRYIYGDLLSNVYLIKRVAIPSGVTYIYTYTFSNCYGVEKYDFTACESVPTLAGTNAFNEINATCQILVPSSLYDEWIAATNWSTYADYIVAV